MTKHINVDEEVKDMTYEELAYRKGYMAGHSAGRKYYALKKGEVVHHNICSICKRKQERINNNG